MERAVTARHIILAVASVAVLAMGVYLFAEVRATPATADVTPRTKRDAPQSDDADKQPEKVATTTQPSRPQRDAAIKKPAPPPPPPPPDRGSDPAPSLSPDSISEELAKPNPKLDAVMAEANKAYDRGDFDDAKGIALKVLAKDPANVRMLRIAVSAACIDGDSGEAQKHFQALPVADREQMKVRCARYGVTFNQ